MGKGSIKKSIFEKRVQEIEINKDGLVIASDQSIFSIPKNSILQDFHPFFYTIAIAIESLKKSISFPCIHIEKDNFEKIIDVELLKQEDCFYVVLIDLTEHYLNAQPIVQEKNESSIAKYKLDFENKLLAAKEQFKNSFLSNLNHEVRNPLNNILVFLDLLAETKLDFDQKETLKLIQNTGIHLKVLMDDMLDISKIESGIMEVKKVNFDLSKFLASIERHFKIRFKEKPIDFQVDIEEKIHRYYIGDPIKLNQILHNLIENALRNTKEGIIKLSVSAIETKEQDKNTSVLKFSLSDTGAGIDDNYLDKVFNKYFQLKIDEIEPIGEGLGLKIVKDLVDLIEGSIKVTSHKDKGSNFTFTIPVETRIPKKKKKTVDKGTGLLIRKRILVVEDDLTNQMLFMKLFLNNDFGYTLDFAMNSKDAITLVENKKIALVITNSSETSMKLSNFIKSLKALSTNVEEEVPVIVATGKTMLEQQEEIIRTGASFVLAKPFTKKELFKTIAVLLK